MNFRFVFIALTITGVLVVGAFAVHSRRPAAVLDQPTASLVRASGKCAECHSNQQYSIVHEYELSKHAEKHVNCLDCHSAAKGQESKPHHGFEINTQVTAANCRSCHESIYQQFLRSRHAAPSWAAVFGDRTIYGRANCVQRAVSSEVGQAARQMRLSVLEGHIGYPERLRQLPQRRQAQHRRHDRHLHRLPLAPHILRRTCPAAVNLRPVPHGPGPFATRNLYGESNTASCSHAQQQQSEPGRRPEKLTTRDMFVPTCATCHMSGLNGMAMTHDPSERLSYNLFDEISEKRPNYARAQAAMKDLCSNCHTSQLVDQCVCRRRGVRSPAPTPRSLAAKAIMDGLRKDGLLRESPSRNRSISRTSTFGITTAEPPSMGRSWAGPISFNGTATTRCCSILIEIKSMADEMRTRS